MKKQNLILGVLTLLAMATSACGAKKWDPDSFEVKMPKVEAPEISDFDLPEVEIVKGSAVEGLWMGPLHEDGEMSIRSILSIQDGVLQITSICARKGVTTEAIASAPVLVSEASLEVLKESVQASEIKGEAGDSVTCEVRIEKGIIPYEIVAGKLFFRLHGEKILVGESKMMDQLRVEVR